MSKVFLLAIDGLEWNLLEKFMREGKLPTFEKFLQKGSYGKTDLSGENYISPVIWTTIATGKPSTEHGIRDFVDENGVLVTSNLIRTKRIWDILSENNISSGVVGWMVTYPPVIKNGFIISDIFNQVDGIYPKRIIINRPKFFINLKSKLKEFSSFAFEEDYRKKYDESSNEWIRSSLFDTRLKYILHRDELLKQWGLKLYKKHKTDFMTIYLQGLDYTSHAFWRYMTPDEFKDIKKFGFDKTSEEDIAYFGKIIERYYIYMDEILNEVLEVIDEETNLFIISDHGFERIHERHIVDKGPLMARFLSGNHSTYGFFCASGNKIKSTKLHNIPIFDIVPTILNIFNLPIGKDMKGRVLQEIFNSPNNIKYINTYESGSIVSKDEKAIKTDENEEIIERLKGLGYL